MSELTKNQLLNRRGFFQRSARTAAIAGAGATMFSLGHQGSAASSGTPNPWAYDDSAFRKTDPKLIRYHEVSRFRCPRPSPRCLDLSKDERLFIGAGRYLTEHTLDGTQVSEIALDGEPRCIAAATDGRLYIGLRERIEVYDRKGRRLEGWESPGKKAYFTGLAATETDVFVADAGSRAVLRYDRSGKLKARIGERDKERNVPGFIVPSPFFDVELGPEGLLHVTNPGRHRVEAYTADGDLELVWGKPGAAIENFCGCCNPINLALLSDGRVVTFEKGIPRVKVYGADGTLDSVVAGAEAFEENAKVCGPNDCTLGGLDGVVDAKGRIYILDFVAGEVRVMESNKARAGEK
jgi:hypothetical protein